MFYPAELLRRGGRFYICWMADSWPARFASVTQRQLQSANIVQICDELQEVIVTESGAPGRRFSLRLSARLLHGLIVIYERKASQMLRELCMFDANILRYSKTRYEHPQEKRVRRPTGAARRQVQEAEAADAERQALDNVVANVDEITLREEVIPERIVLVDNFGEENPLDVLQQLESMRLEPAAEPTRGSLELEPEAASIVDKTAQPSHGPITPHAEMATLHSILLQDEPTELLNKDITNVEIPSIQVHPAVSSPPPEEQMVLEELAERPARRRRRRRRLLLDRATQIDAETMKSRIKDHLVETKERDRIQTQPGWVKAEEHMRRRSARGWRGAVLVESPDFVRLYTRNLAPMRAGPRASRDVIVIPESYNKKRRSSHIDILRQETTAPKASLPQPPELTLLEDLELLQDQLLPQNLVLPQDLTLHPDLSLPHDLPLLQDLEVQQDLALPQDLVRDPTALEQVTPRHPLPVEAEKENVEIKKRLWSEGMPEISKRQKISKCTLPAAVKGRLSAPESDERGQLVTAEQRASLWVMQHAPGLCEAAPLAASPGAAASPAAGPAAGAARSETPLGSLDRTRVSLGDSVDTTDSTSFMKDHWCPRATLLKVISRLQDDVRPLTVDELLQHGPLLPGKKRLIAAHCFTSILKLKQAGFLSVRKDPITLEIVDIDLGVKFSTS